MAIIDARRRVIVDTWFYPGIENPADLNTILRLDELTALNESRSISRPIGALLPPDTLIETLAPYLNRLDLVAVEFPKFRDGRGFTIARSLREHHHYRGDIRAVGHILPDQFAALVQCGFSSILTPPDHPPDQWQQVAILSPVGKSRSGPLLRRLLNDQSSENHRS